MLHQHIPVRGVSWQYCLQVFLGIYRTKPILSSDTDSYDRSVQQSQNAINDSHSDKSRNQKSQATEQNDAVDKLRLQDSQERLAPLQAMQFDGLRQSLPNSPL